MFSSGVWNSCFKIEKEIEYVYAPDGENLFDRAKMYKVAREDGI